MQKNLFESKKKLKLFLYGTGEKAAPVLESLIVDVCTVKGVINSSAKAGDIWKGYRVSGPESLLDNDFDYVLIASSKYAEEIISRCLAYGVQREKIINYWNEDLSIYPFISPYPKQNFILKKENRLLAARLENMPYEDGSRFSFVHILPTEDLFKKIISEKKSLARFGDGEFDIIRGVSRSWFQRSSNRELSERLERTLNADSEDVLLAIADDFGSLSKYTKDAADGIRLYLAENVREEVQNLFKKKFWFYDAYVTRPYIIYKDKEYSKWVFEQWRKVFHNRSIILVEGKLARIGINNDLLGGATSIRRILCPSMNAYDHYEEILKTIRKNYNKDDLVLISLGAAATVLAFDLGASGIQAIDIGQLDNEYDWFRMGVSDRTAIPGKMTAEFDHQREIEKVAQGEYQNQIVAEIG